MRKNKLFVTTALALFLLANLTIATAYAAKPAPLPPLMFDGYVSSPGYLPGVPRPLGKSGIVKLEGRQTTFTLELPGIGLATFVSIEDSIMNEVYVGTTHGRITVTDALGNFLTEAESNGKVFPTSVPTLMGEMFAIGFKGSLATIGKGNRVVHITGEYTGYFIPHNLEMTIGYFHIDAELKSN